VIELVKLGLDTLGGLITSWIGASEQQRIELEKRALDGIAVMKGERTLTHDALDASEAETRKAIAEAKAKLEGEDTRP
jgi:hypothetical protein